MPRPVILFTNGWTDLPLDDLAGKAAEWGYAGLELCCWGDHFEVQRALERGRLRLRPQLDLLARPRPAGPGPRATTASGRPSATRSTSGTRPCVPDYVWGDGKPTGRAAAGRRGDGRHRSGPPRSSGRRVVSGFTGSPLWSYVAGYPAPTPEIVAAGFQDFVKLWTPGPGRRPATRGCGSRSRCTPGRSRSTCTRPRRSSTPWTAGRSSGSRSTRATCTGRGSTRSSSSAGSRTASTTSTSRTRR